MSQKTKQKTAFIDRDGTLIQEVNFLSKVEDLQLFDFTQRSVDLLLEHGFRVVIITNQSGIARRLYDEAAMNAIHDEIQKRLSGAISGFYFCPHLPGYGCKCRKPNLGMIEAACSDFDVDMANSWMIGDKSLDVETGFNAGIKSAMVMTGYGREHLARLEKTPSVVAENLLEAVNKIISVSVK